ncbi:MAG TPA: excinuclease ABC subunit UvrC [Firmicutes bacterium]|nr:excinuclease ABC subunit UvrC [Candidatus Fermentithermobacillaceae bacterium]
MEGPLSHEPEAWVGLVGDRHELADKIRECPDSPGVYVFRGIDGKVLYVGKAKNLKNRLRSYFGSDLSPKTEALMSRVARLETIVVGSETEAFLLELNLIKKHRPEYNIRLRDDKHYPYIRVGVEDPWPRVTVVRRRQRDGARYFGPYARAHSVRETLSVLRRIFPYRTCTDSALAQATRPCLDYHIGRCMGPCTGNLDRANYKAMIDEVVKFLEGRHGEVKARLESRMRDYAEAMEFEKAAQVRDQIRALEDVTRKQLISVPDWKDRDLIGLARSHDTAFVALLTVREGKLVGKEGFVLQGAAEESDAQVLEAFIVQYYSSAQLFPHEILVPVEIPSSQNLEEFLRNERRAQGQGERATHIRTPRRGRSRELVVMAQDNARNMMEEQVPREEREYAANRKAMEALRSFLSLERLPRRIEGYDISNLTGKQAVASMVVLTDGKPDRSQYRKFRMKIEGKPNDFAMMQEVLWRRFKKGLAEREEAKSSGKHGKFAVFPDLIMVDGGKGQVSAAQEVLRELGLDIPLVGLAKRNEELFLPGRSEPVELPRDSGGLFLVMRLRDEAHRFAVSYHRTLRGKEATQSVLEEIPGVGPSRARELLRAFGDVEAIRSATPDEIARVKGIGPQLAGTILEALKRAGGTRPRDPDLL